MTAQLIILLVLIFLMGLSFGVQSAFRKTSTKYAAINSKSHKTGSEVARMILNKHGIIDVQIIKGNTKEYADNFNPQTKIVTLSNSVYDSTSISAIAIAAHEVGHAIQYAKQGFLIKARTALVGPVMVVQRIGSIIFQVGMLIAIFTFGSNPLVSLAIIGAGVVMFGFSSLFNLVTLPIEFDASKKGKQNLLDLGIISEKDSEEYEGVSKVLNKAAMTYVVGFLVSFAMFLYFLLIILSRRN